MVRISDDPHRFDPGAELLHEDGRTLVVASTRGHRDRFLVFFEGIETREEAERLRGALYIGSDSLRDLDEGEYWEHQLIGCEVVDETGTVFGTVVRLDPAPAQDLLVIRGPRGEQLVPMVKEIVVSVDPDAQRIVIDPPEGLLE